MADEQKADIAELTPEQKRNLLFQATSLYHVDRSDQQFAQVVRDKYGIKHPTQDGMTRQVPTAEPKLPPMLGEGAAFEDPGVSVGIKTGHFSPPNSVQTRYFLHTASFAISGASERTSIQTFLNTPGYQEITYDEKTRLLAIIEQNNLAWKGVVHKHRGQTIHVFGNGPSLKTLPTIDWEQEITVGVNAAYLSVPSLKYWVLCDPLIQRDRPLHQHMECWYMNNQNTVKVVNRGATDLLNTPLPNLFFQFGRPDLKAGNLFWHHSSVHAAIHFAMILGAAKIYLWGVDYVNRGHFYNGRIEKDQKDIPDQQWDNFVKHELGFKELAKFAHQRRVQIFNANRSSRLRVFPFECPYELNISEPLPPPPILVNPVFTETTEGIVLPPIDKHLGVIGMGDPAPDAEANPEHSAKFIFDKEIIEITKDGETAVVPFSQIKADPKLKHILNGVKALRNLPVQ